MSKNVLSRPPHAWLGALSILSCVAMFTGTAGLAGVLAGSVVTASWWIASPLYAYVLGQFAVVALGLPMQSIIVFAGIETALLGVLVTPLIQHIHRARWMVGAAAGVGLGAIGGWAGVTLMTPVWQAALVIVGTMTGLAYGLHRYEQLVLGLIDADTSNHE